MTAIDRLQAVLGTGAENAKSRQMLSAELGISDRALRRLVHDARNSGIAVISTSHNSGYYLSDDEAETQHLIAELLSRANKHYETARKLERGMQIQGQERL